MYKSVIILEVNIIKIGEKYYNMDEQLLINLLQNAVSPFACIETVSTQLKKNGFEKLEYSKSWEILPGRKYYVEHHGTALFAFTIGRDYKANDMIRIAAAHTDYPCMRIKPNCDFKTDVYAQVNLEVYGGPILNTWFDRPLGVAGRVALKSADPFSPKMVTYVSKKPVIIIPNLAIHMNRDVNNGVAINNQIDLMPIIDLIPDEQKSTDYFISFIADELGIDKNDIIDFELNTYCMELPVYVGPKETLLSSPRLDNQTSVYALLSSIIDGTRGDGINMIALFDHEEIGSSSKQGAGSILLHDMLGRILRLLNNSDEQIEGSMYDSILLSVDVAHAMHPNHISKMDITNKPVLGKGFCIKEACSQSYATDSEVVSIVCQICERNHIPYQRFVNRSDVRGGGTLGSIASTLLPVKTVDIGVPILAMHSANEVMGKQDITSLREFITAFFSL